MGQSMRRRDFIGAVVGAGVWPVAALGQEATAAVVGLLGDASLEGLRGSFAPAQRRLAEMGYIEGRNLALEYRWANFDQDRLPALAGDLVKHRVAAIVAFGGPAIAAAKNATTSIPIIFFTGFDPVQSGLVASLNRPGGNVTGIALLNTELLAKRLEMLRELVPTAKSVAVLYDPKRQASSDREISNFQLAARALGFELIGAPASSPSDFEGAFASITSAHVDALFVGADGVFFSNREVIVGLAAQHKLPAIYPIRVHATAGGLVSYGPNYPEAYRQVGDYLGRVLKGEKPENLPVMQATKIELVINMKTATALGLTVPLSLLGRADEVIE